MTAVPKYLKVEHTVAIHCKALVPGSTREFPCPMERTWRSAETPGGRPPKNGMIETVEFNGWEKKMGKHSLETASRERRRVFSSVSEEFLEDILMTSCS
jgi:hypothetical protein